MNASKPALFVNITPVSPDGVTVVDLGGEMGQDVPVIRHSSLPPSPTRAEYGDSMSGVRHGSLPPPSKQPKMKILSSVEDSIEEMSDDSEGAGATEPPQNSSTLGVQVNPAMDREGDDEALVGPVATSSSTGMAIPRNSEGIKNEKTKTCWFIVWSQSAISEPHTLHPSVTLELGDIFINQFRSEKHQKQALQVWVLVKVDGSNNLMWKQVVPDKKTYHPKLKDRILAFQPSKTKTVPTWIKAKTDRPSRSMPLIVHGQG